MKWSWKPERIPSRHRGPLFGLITIERMPALAAVRHVSPGVVLWWRGR